MFGQLRLRIQRKEAEPSTLPTAVILISTSPGSQNKYFQLPQPSNSSMIFLLIPPAV